jgi:hypothetical protein
MYTFTIALFFGLAVMGLVTLADRYLTAAREAWVLAAMAVGVALAWATGFDFWELWGEKIRAAWLGITLTGVALGGLAYLWHEVIRLFTGLERKTNDEAEALEARQLHRAA